MVTAKRAGLVLNSSNVPLSTVQMSCTSKTIRTTIVHRNCSRRILFIRNRNSLLGPTDATALPLLQNDRPARLILYRQTNRARVCGYPRIPVPPLSRIITLCRVITTTKNTFTKTGIITVTLGANRLSTSTTSRTIRSTVTRAKLPYTSPFHRNIKPVLSTVLS